MTPVATKTRKSHYPILPAILQRTASRALIAQPIADDLLYALFEAARWAPSSYNNQPWRFVYAKRESTSFATFLDFLVPANQAWAKEAAVLIVVLSKKTFDKDGKPSITHSFDTGAACLNLALEGTSKGLIVHPMQGFDYDKAKKTLRVSDTFHVEAMIAVGFPDVERQKAEVLTDRKPLDDLCFEGLFAQ